MPDGSGLDVANALKDAKSDLAEDFSRVPVILTPGTLPDFSDDGIHGQQAREMTDNGILNGIEGKPYGASDIQTALIDAGEATFYFDYGERVILPLLNYLGIEKIDYGFVSHLDLDHYGGFVELILKDRIGEIYKPVLDNSLTND